jgi:hypothetical protein
MVPSGAAMRTARCTSLRSWRTLPGHWNVSKMRAFSALRRTPVFPAAPRLAKEKRAQVRDLFAPFAQRRDVNANDAQAIKEIFAKSCPRDAVLEIRIGCGDHAHVRRVATRIADRQHFTLLEEPQQFGCTSSAGRRPRRGTTCRHAVRRTPGRSAMAPVKEPRRWPNSWLSASSRWHWCSLWEEHLARRSDPA